MRRKTKRFTALHTYLKFKQMITPLKQFGNEVATSNEFFEILVTGYIF